MDASDAQAAAEAVRSTWISGGPHIEEFERQVALITDSPYALAVSNGTTALNLALLSLGLGPGDEVVVPGFTFVAPANMVLSIGAKLVTADVDPTTWCIDPASVASVVTPRTRAIVVVHLYGNVADMDPLLDIAERHGAVVIEDCAQSFLSRYKGRAAGTIGQIGTFSFQAAKAITTGEGGMVLTRSPEHYRRMALLRDHGMAKDRRYWHEVIGHNFRLTNIQAAIGCSQLKRLEFIVAERRRVHATYRRLLKDVIGFSEQFFPADVDPVIGAFAGRIAGQGEPFESVERRRDKVMALMSRQGIETRPGFFALSSLPPYDCPELPVSCAVAASVISLPTYPDLDDLAIERICQAFEASLREAAEGREPAL